MASIIEFLPKDELYQNFETACQIVAGQLLTVLDQLKKQKTSRIIKRLIYFNMEVDYYKDFYAAIMSRKKFDERQRMLADLFIKEDIVFIQFEQKFGMGMLVLPKKLDKEKRNDLIQLGCFKPEAEVVAEAIFKGLEAEGFGTLNPSDEQVEEEKEAALESQENQLSAEAKAFLSQPSPCYF